MESLICSSSAINELTSLSLPSRFKLLSLSSSISSSNPLFFPIKRRNIQRYRVQCSNKLQNSTKLTSFQPLPFPRNSNSSKFQQNGDSLLNCIKNSIVLTLFCIVVGFIPVGALQKPAIAFSFTGLLSRNEETETKKESRWKDHEFSHYSSRLLETVSVLLKRIEDVRSSKGNMKEVMKALQEVESKKYELVDEIMSDLNAELDKMKKEKKKLLKQSKKIVVSAEEIQENVKDREVVQDEVARLEEVYNDILDKVDDIDDTIERRETLTLSIGIRELSFIERESKLLVERFKHEVDHQNMPSVPMSSTSMHSKPEIQRELEVAQKEYWEQMLLPHALELEDTELPLDQHTEDFVLNIKQGFKESRELQKEVEASIRHKMKRAGNEKRFLVKTPADEVVKGYPEAELKWVFGDKEVVVPKAIKLHLFHGWKKWSEEVQTDLKTDLLDNTDQVKPYVAKRQERILVDRDRVVAKTWFNEERNRWEMDPLAMPYAITKKLVENVRIRHDWGAMFVALKGEDKEYYVDVQELDLLYEDFGGFDGLYLKMLASGIPTAVQLMWIPLSDLGIQQQFLLAMRLSYWWLVGLWKSKIVSFVRNGFDRELKNTSMDIMMMIIVPTIDLIVPFEIRMRLGMAYPERSDQVATSTKYLKWLSEVETSFASRKKDGFRWHLWFFIRVYICGYILFNVLLYAKKKVPRLLGFGPIRKNPIRRKWRKMKNYFLFKRRRMRRRRRRGVNPIARAFDRMKRLRRVKIPLKDFASIDSMREEINEVVTFLRDPSAFQEVGARAPRGVLIVGDRGTGKTTLAAAIAAEAKVPIVVVDSKQMEAGLWVGQSASNIRELFQTARDLAPVILFVENFDLFAGVRGKYIHTKKQDHEAFINQLLVELDGFEKQDGVVLMATTRNLNKIDQALRRPGRMDRIFTLQRPTQMEREKILKTSAKSTMDDELVDFVNWEKVAEKTALLRPTELKRVPMALEASAFRSKFLDKDELRSYIGWFATFRRVVPRWLWKTKIAKGVSKSLVNHLGLTLTKENLQSVVDLMEPYGRLSPGIELLNPPHDWTRESKFPHAVWASGRALVALLLPNFDVVHNIWLEPFSWEGIGCTKITKVKDEDSMDGNVETRSYLEKKLVFCFGSYIASQMLLPFGEDNFLSSSELKQAQELATRMVIQYGWGPDDSPAIYYCGKALTTLSMGDNHEYEMATKVERIYNLAYDKAREMLQKNNTVLEKIIEELLEFEVLTGKDLQRILKENDGLVEKEPFFLSSSYHKEIPSGSPPDDESASGLALLSAPTKQ